MKQPTIKAKVCEYSGKLWVIQDAVMIAHTNSVRVRLVDGDETCFAEMAWVEYDALNDALPRQEFVILPAVVAPAPPPKPVMRWKGGGSYALSKCDNCKKVFASHYQDGTANPRCEV